MNDQIFLTESISCIKDHLLPEPYLGFYAGGGTKRISKGQQTFVYIHFCHAFYESEKNSVGEGGFKPHSSPWIWSCLLISCEM